MSHLTISWVPCSSLKGWRGGQWIRFDDRHDEGWALHVLWVSVSRDRW